MKKKIFTLLALALCISSAAWAETATITLSGGTEKVGSSSTVAVPSISSSNENITLGTCGATCANAGYHLTNRDGKFVTFNSTNYYLCHVYDSNGKAKLNDAGATNQYGTFTIPAGYTYTISSISHALASVSINVDFYIVIKDASSNEKYKSSKISTTSSSNESTISATEIKNLSTELEAGTYTINLNMSSSNTSTGKYFGLAQIALTGELTSSDSPAITASPSSLTLAATEPGTAVSSTFTITGSNLTDGNYSLTVPSVTGLSVSPTSFSVSGGTVNQVVTVSYSSTENVKESSTNITATVGELDFNVAVNYSASVASWTLQPISTETVWDFSKLAANTLSSLYSSDGIKLTNETTPSLNDDVVYANYGGTHITFGAGFDATTISFKGEYPIRKNQFAQNGTLHIKTTVPGTIVVKFSDTGSSANANAVKRYLVVNGNPTEYWASRPNNSSDPDVAYEAQLNVTSGDIPVPAGDVTITGTSALVISYVKFTPAAATTISLNGSGYATYSNYYDVAVSGAKVYTAELNFANAKITCHKVNGGKVPAGQGVLLYGDANAKVTLTPTTGAGDLTNNQLHATTLADGTLASKGDGDCYSLSGDTFMKYTSESFVANKAYFEVLSSGSYSARSFTIEFVDGGYATAIDGVSAAERSADSVYDLQGRRVEKPVKGIYVVNGKKVVIK